MIGWENDRGAYFINKLNEAVDAIKKSIGDIVDDIGKLSSLKTTSKTSVVSAINEVHDDVDSAVTRITTLEGTALKYLDGEQNNYTMGSNNYLEITRPSALSGKTIVYVGTVDFTNNSDCFNIITTVDHDYLVAKNGTTVNGLKCRYWYMG